MHLRPLAGGAPGSASGLPGLLQADPPMITSSLFAFALSISIGLNLVALYVFLKTRRAAPPAAEEGERWVVPVEIPTELGAPVAPVAGMPDNANPLVEAEVFLIYGRNDDAARVLKAGLRDGRIGAEDLSRFWSRHGGWPTGDGGLAGAGL